MSEIDVFLMIWRVSFSTARYPMIVIFKEYHTMNALSMIIPPVKSTKEPHYKKTY